MEQDDITSTEEVSPDRVEERPHAGISLEPADPVETVGGGEAAEEAGAWLDLLEDPDHAYRAIEQGETLEGIVMQIDADEILVDIGAKSEGVVSNREFRKALQAGELEDLRVGDPVYVFVLRSEDGDGRATLSIDRARLEKSWRWLEQLHRDDSVTEATVDGFNKGGLLVDLRGVRGFIPSSQVEGIWSSDAGDRQEALSRMVGEVLPLKVIEIDRSRNRLILSQRQALRESRKEELLQSLEVGQVRKGAVNSICNFGVFVDLGGADGLVHLSELSWERVDHPRDVVQVGQEVEVYVLGIDQERKRIALSLRRTQPEPWSTVGERYLPGQLVQGEVTHLAGFGAFVRIEEGIEGLIHISELSDDPIDHPREAVREGDVVTVRVLRVDPGQRRMGLSLRRALHEIREEGVDGEDSAEVEEVAE